MTASFEAGGERMAQENGEQQSVQTPEPVVQAAPAQQTDGGQTQATPASEQPQTQKWMSQLPDGLKGDERLSKYNSLGDAIKALLDGSGTKKADEGKEPSTEGKDQEPEGTGTNYAFTKQFSKEADADGSLEKGLADALKSLGLPQDQADKIHGAVVDYSNGNMERLKTHGKELCEQVLRQSWGDKYDAKLAAMKRAYGKLVPDGSDLDKGLKMTQADNNPFVAQLLSTIGESISEHQPLQPDSIRVPRDAASFLVREHENYPWMR
jgi:hypothetical protein